MQTIFLTNFTGFLSMKANSVSIHKSLVVNHGVALFMLIWGRLDIFNLAVTCQGIQFMFDICGYVVVYYFMIEWAIGATIWGPKMNRTDSFEAFSMYIKSVLLCMAILFYMIDATNLTHGKSKESGELLV